MIHGQHPIVVHVYIRLHSARLSTTFNDPHLPSWNVFFFLIFFSYSMFSFSFPSYRSFFKFLIRTREKFSFFLYMRMTKKSFPIRWQWGIRPCFERSHRLMFYHCYVTPTTESSAQRERNLDHSATLPVINWAVNNKIAECKQNSDCMQLFFGRLMIWASDEE